MNLRPELAAAIEAFRSHPDAVRCRTPDGARGRCARVNTAFAIHCWRRGLDARLVWFTGPGEHAFKPSCLLLASWVAGRFVDWSARQYHQASLLPHVFAELLPEVTGKPWPLRLACEPADEAALTAAGLEPLVRSATNQPGERMLAALHRRRRALLALRGQGV